MCGGAPSPSPDADQTPHLNAFEHVTVPASVPVIASGGADSPAHLVEAVRAGADAVLAASIFHRGDYDVGEIKQALAASGVEVRP